MNPAGAPRGCNGCMVIIFTLHLVKRWDNMPVVRIKAQLRFRVVVPELRSYAFKLTGSMVGGQMEDMQDRPEGPHDRKRGMLRVLVVDDDEDIRRLLVDVLTSAGHLVADVANGTAAIETFKNGSFDLVLTDLEMPELSGWEIARSLKKLSPGIMIVLITGWGDTLDGDQLKESGISRIVNKPFRVDEILSLAGEAQAKKRCREN